jgi:gliding motility-associated-like protein
LHVFTTTVYTEGLNIFLYTQALEIPGFKIIYMTQIVTRNFAKTIFLVNLIAVLSVARLFGQAPTVTSFSPASGAVGTLVTLAGTNLDAPTALSIGGQPAILISNTGSVLVAMVMPGAATGTVSITTAGGMSTGSGIFTVTATLYPLSQQGDKLVGTGGSRNPQQGYAVSISADGNTAIVGGYNDNNGIGAAWVYTRSSGSWTQQGNKLVGTGGSSSAQQGYSVSLSADGNTAIVGGYNDNNGIGAAWVYTRSSGSWTQQGNKLVGTGGSSNPLQGYSVSLSADGNTAIVGGFNDNNSIGAAWVYTRSSGSWAQQGAKLVGTGGSNYTQQGYSVSLSADGNTAMVGGPNDNDGSGAAWVYTRSSGNWTQQGAKLEGTGGSNYARQGTSVSLSADGNTAMVGGYGDNNYRGAAWVYTRSGSSWAQQGAKLVGTGASRYTQQGRSVSLSADGNTAIVGGPGDNDSEGASWVYTRSSGSWVQQGNKLTGVGTGGLDYTQQGVSVSLSADGSTAIVGGVGYDSGQGGAWAYMVLTTPAIQATNILFTGTTTTTTTASWTNGNGSARAVFMLAGNTGIPAPVDLTTYTAETEFGSGMKIRNSGWYCIYNGTGSTVNITGLTPGTTYRIMTVEYNGTGSNLAYSTRAGTGNPTVITTISSDATLSDLSMSSGTINTTFASSIYTASVTNATSSITLTPTATDAGATIKINGTTVVSGAPSGNIALNAGSNTITTIVTAQDGTTTKTYTLTVTRAASAVATLSASAISSGTLSPAFASGTTNYTASVTSATSSITLTPTATDATATIKVNGTTVASGATSGSIALSTGANTITTVVTAQDGTTTQTYTLTVTKAVSSVATLSAAAISSGMLSPAFASGTTNYTASVTNATSSITLTPTATDATATIKVNGTTVASGAASGSIALNLGANTITTVVTAQDGTTTQTYTLTVTRAVSAVATLSAAAISSGILSPAFASGTTNYTASVANSTSSITLVPTATDATAIIKVNGTTVVSGVASSGISLNVGSNTITIVVTAQDGITTKTYTLTITRAASSVATLTNLSLSSGLLSPGFVSGTATYSVSVGGDVNIITITPTFNSTASATINGTPTSNGGPSFNIGLNNGNNYITLTITAQDGVTKNTYLITVYKALSPNSILPTNILSPNGDGKNDYWLVKDIELYPQNKVTIFDPAGKPIYTKNMYSNNWDGSINGTPLAQGTYYYIIELAPGINPLKGFITIIKSR